MGDWASWIPERVTVGDVSYSSEEWANAYMKPLGIDHPDAPSPSTPKIKSHAGTHHVSNWDEDTKTVSVKILDQPLSPSILSDIIGQFRQDGHPVIAFCKVIIEHGGILTGQNIVVIDRLGFTRDKPGEFTFTYDYSNPRRKQDFTPVEPPPVEPEWNAFETELASIRERQAFCDRNNIRFLQDELDRAKWLEARIAEEKAFRESPAMKAIDDAIAALGEQIAELQKGKS